MNELQKKYEKYMRTKTRYIKFRNQSMNKPRHRLKVLINDLRLEALRTEFIEILQRKMKRAWGIYKKLYFERLNDCDIETFISLADEIMEYSEFLSDGESKIWKVSRDLVRSYNEHKTL